VALLVPVPLRDPVGARRHILCGVRRRLGLGHPSEPPLGGLVVGVGAAAVLVKGGECGPPVRRGVALRRGLDAGKPARVDSQDGGEASRLCPSGVAPRGEPFRELLEQRDRLAEEHETLGLLELAVGDRGVEPGELAPVGGRESQPHRQVVGALVCICRGERAQQPHNPARQPDGLRARCKIKLRGGGVCIASRL